MMLSPRAAEIWITGVAVVIAMALTGAVSARLGRMPIVPSVARNVAGGVLANLRHHDVARAQNTVEQVRLVAGLPIPRGFLARCQRLLQVRSDNRGAG